MLNAFLLTRQWRDTRDGIVLDFWWATDKGACWTQVNAQEIVFFVLRSHGDKITKKLSGIRKWRMAEVELKTYRNLPVNALYFKSQRGARDAQDILSQASIEFWEADIRPHERYLMERFVTAGAVIDIDTPDNSKPILNPRLTPSEIRRPLTMVSVDIETTMDAKQLFSIAVWGDQAAKVFMVGDAVGRKASEKYTEEILYPDLDIVFCKTQKECLQDFFIWLNEYDPDILIGWSVVQFDLWVLETLCQQEGLTLALGRGAQSVHWRQEDEEGGRRFVVIPGRVALDGIELLKAANYRFESYALQFVAEQLLDKGKLLHGKDRGNDITRLFNEDKIALAEYNLRDCELVWDIFANKKLLHFAVERSQLTGLLLDRIGGSVAAFEYSYLPRLHRKGYIAPNLGELESDVVSPGGYVMDSQPGIFDNILVLDFKSLYPSIIRTFLIDPCASWIAKHQQLSPSEVVAGFNEAKFAREGHILPQMIEYLWQARDIAKQEKNAPLSHAIKIIMNSFYGVLGSTGCRFFDPRVCSSITLRGHEIIQRSRAWIEEQGYTVIYGDTDSLFVWVENNGVDRIPKNQSQCQKIGERLARELNVWWQQTLQTEHAIKSQLEIQFETHYLKFLMPTIRGSEVGTKKRYAGVIEHNGARELVFKGLENVRTDWTRLARNFQETLYAKVFAGEDYLDFLRSTVADVLAGKRNQDLIYQKRLRRHLHEYEKNIPPQVQAARKYVQLTGKSLRRGDWISYVITTSGAEPVEAQQSPLDYQHYVDKQLMPVADGILHFMEQTMTELVDTQMSLFAN
ncbi:MAG: DNA polymerase II [Gammaproteobacteria bacterium]|nr:MAG: DNA polymerase II [Gammaproteobacteria bacterium]